MLASATKPALKLFLLPSVMVASLTLGACQKNTTPIEDDGSNSSESVATDAANNENKALDTVTTDDSQTELSATEKLSDDLSRHHWTLVSVKDAAKQPVSVLMDVKDQVTLSFNRYQSGERLSYSVGCNTISAAYQLQAQTLTTENGMSTKMSCGSLDMAESQLNTMMQGSSELQITDGENPLLTQVTTDSATLVWQGRLTPQAKYNSKGETVFWAVNAQKAPCDATGSEQCLQVKPVTYSDEGVKTSEGEWTVFTGEIDGYQHDGKHDEVIRLQRYQLENENAEEDEYAYLLDAVIESAVVN